MRQLEPKFGDLKLFFALLALGGLLSACTPQDPVERVTEIRGQYVVELNAWLPQGGSDDGLESDTAAGGEESAAADSEDSDGSDGSDEEGEGAEEMSADSSADASYDEPMSASTDILFDFVVYLGGREALPGVTIDLIHADPFEKEKVVFKQWLDTTGMIKGETRQVSFIRSIDDFVEGDVFSVIVRSDISAAELGDYREYQ